MSWPLVHIGEHVEKVETWNPVSSGIEDLFKYIDLSSVDKDSKSIIESAVNLIHPISAPSRARQIVKENDVLISTVRPNLNGVALVNQELDGATASTGYCVLRADKKSLDSKYLFYWIQSSDFIDDMIKNATGANYPAVSDRIVKNSLIPLPPLEEQKRIAAILDNADAIRRKRQKAIKLADDFLRSVFLEMFGDPVTNPKGWKVRDFGDVCKCSQGIQVDSDLQSDFEKDGYSRFIRIVNYTQPSAPYKYIPTPESQKAYISSSDIVMVRYGATAGFVGRGTEGYLANNLFKISPSKIYDRDFLYFFLCSRYFQNILTDVKQGGAMPALNFGQLNEIKMYEPSISLQRRFSDVTKIVSSLLTRNKVSSRFPLFESLSQKAFSGEL